MNHPGIPDALQLLHALKKGDRQAFESIYRLYWKMMFNTAYKYLHNKEVSEEIVHDILLDLWQRRESVEIGSLDAYLKTAVRFRTINYVTRKKTPFFFELFDSIAFSPGRTEDRLLEKDLLELIRAWSAVLPEKRRKIFLLHFFHQRSAREIADIMGSSQKTVQNQISTTLQLLRARLGQIFPFLFCITLLIMIGDPSGSI